MELATHPAQKMCGRVRVQGLKVQRFKVRNSGWVIREITLLTAFTVLAAVTQLSVRGEAEESRIRKWQTRRDPSLHSG